MVVQPLLVWLWKKGGGQLEHADEMDHVQRRNTCTQMIIGDFFFLFFFVAHPNEGSALLSEFGDVPRLFSCWEGWRRSCSGGGIFREVYWFRLIVSVGSQEDFHLRGTKESPQIGFGIRFSIYVIND